MRIHLGSDSRLSDAFRPRFIGQSATQPVDGTQLLSTLSTQEQRMAAVNAWIQARPAYVQILGVDAVPFTQTYQDAQTLYPTVAAVEQTLQSQTGQINLDSAQYTNVINWIQDVNTLSNYTAQHPEFVPKGASPTGTAVVMPAAAGSAPSPYLVGGVAVAAVGILALVLRK